VPPQGLSQANAIVLDSIGRLIAPANEGQYIKRVILQSSSLSDARTIMCHFIGETSVMRELPNSSRRSNTTVSWSFIQAPPQSQLFHHLCNEIRNHINSPRTYLIFAGVTIMPLSGGASF